MTTHLRCDGHRHLVIADVPGPNDTVADQHVVDDRPCDCDDRPEVLADAHDDVHEARGGDRP